MACFVTFEGIDGAGKSTHIEPLARSLRSLGHAVLCTREPGGTVLAEALRAHVLREPMSALTETLLIFAARRDHIEKAIAPALARGEIVLCDRFTDATFAYQGDGRGVRDDVLRALESWVHDGLEPDLTLWFDVDPRLAAERRARARAADRFETEELDFFTRVRAGYEARMKAAPQRFMRIDAAAPVDEVARHVERAVVSAIGATLGVRGRDRPTRADGVHPGAPDG